MRHIRQQGVARTRPLSCHETSAQDFLLCLSPDRCQTNFPEISCRSSGEVRVQTPCCPYSPEHFHTMVAVSYKPFSVPSKYFERNARRKNGREGQRKDRYTGKEKIRRRR